MIMSNEFGSELTKLGLPATTDAAALAAQALQRSRRRIRQLATLTILLWIFDIVLIPSVMLPLAAKFKQLAQVAAGNVDGQPTPVTVETLAKIIHDILQNIIMVSTAVITMMTLASLLAAICTVWLVLTVRRVTLEQMSAALAQISDQLKRLPNQ
jgi:hypothetical protein